MPCLMSTSNVTNRNALRRKWVIDDQHNDPTPFTPLQHHMKRPYPLVRLNTVPTGGWAESPTNACPALSVLHTNTLADTCSCCLPETLAYEPRHWLEGLRFDHALFADRRWEVAEFSNSFPSRVMLSHCSIGQPILQVSDSLPWQYQ